MKTSALFTDLYELTMAQAYATEHMDQLAVFELTFRQMPITRNYIVAAGISDVLEFLVNFRFSSEELDYLRRRGEFSEVFLRQLEDLRFTGDVYAVPEGTLVFPHEPLVQVIAPILEAQLAETLVLNQIHFQSLVAAKAARVVESAKGRGVVDFGSRRAHGTDAALKVARATYLAGGDGTSNVLAGLTYAIPVFGTMAHSYIEAHDSEAESFEAFAALYPETTLLVDTYDTLEGVRKVIDLNTFGIRRPEQRSQTERFEPRARHLHCSSSLPSNPEFSEYQSDGIRNRKIQGERCCPACIRRPKLSPNSNRTLVQQLDLSLLNGGLAVFAGTDFRRADRYP